MIIVLLPSSYEYNQIDPDLFHQLDVRIIESGIGKLRTSITLSKLILKSKPTWILLSGYCGALSNSFRVGDIVSGINFIESDLDLGSMQNLITDSKLECGGLTHNQVSIYCQDKFLKDNPYGRQNSVTDMESHATALFCKTHSIRFSVVKVVSDIVGSNSEAQFIENSKLLSTKLNQSIIESIKIIKKSLDT